MAKPWRLSLIVAFLAVVASTGCGILTPQTEQQLADSANHVVSLAGQALEDYLAQAIIDYGAKHPEIESNDIIAALSTTTAAVHEADPVAPKSRAVPKAPDAGTVHALKRLLKR